MHYFINRILNEADQSMGAPTLHMNNFLNRILTGMHQSEHRSSKATKAYLALRESLRKRTSPSIGAPRLQMHTFLKRIFKETDQSGPGSSKTPNAYFSQENLEGNGSVWAWEFQGSMWITVLIESYRN